MIGLFTYLGSSPRRLLAIVSISAALIAAAQFAPLLQRSATPPDVGTQSVSELPVANPRYARVFESRPIPARQQEIPSSEGDSGNPSPGLGGPFDTNVEAGEAGPVEITVDAIVTDGEAPESVERLTLRPTAAWVNVFGESSTINGEPIQPEDTITAFDPDGMLIGRSVVEVEGRYGVMALYMDDPVTSVDEGAEPGDLISFKVNGVPAVVLGSDDPIWTENGAIIIANIAAGDNSVDPG